MADPQQLAELPGGYPSAAGLTDDQLHGVTCRCCDGPATAGAPLTRAGHVYTSTGPGRAPLGWPVVAHPDCTISEDQ
ncbi:hypothetical protein ACIRRH_00515 [Kitasatospora sp. NPDC101235]|uniref:hypothetical protein n=1 Tax=Kitasatospora sp. NPDC101235 TaxID=3364101 RepID=UPI0037F7A651